jgi:zinc-ribbon domain
VAFCSTCGKALGESARFCSGCGTGIIGAQVTTTSGAAAAPARVTRVVVVEPKKGGRLAFKGFLTAFILAIIFIVATKSDKGPQAVGMVVAFGIGAAYIITNLRKWKKDNEVVHGAGIGWTVAILLLLMCLGGLMSLGSSGSGPSSISSGNQTLGIASPTVDPKDALLRDVKLEYKWYKEGFGNVMIADFSINNPTQYRFKDVEIKCTHSAPSGTVIDSNTRTIYEIVEPKSTKVIKQMNMGFIHSQASRSGCDISNLTPIQ